MRTRTYSLFLCCIISLLTQTISAQFPKIKIEQRTNLSYLTCLDNFTLEARQMNWETFDFTQQEILFHQINFVTRDSGFALCSIQGAGENDYFFTTSDAGKTWNFDPTLGNQMASNLHVFGNDTLLLFGKNRRSWYSYDYYQFHSFDGGTTWDSTQTNLNIDLQKSFFIHPHSGFCVDVNGQTYFSSDMGITWEKRGTIDVGANIKMWFTSPKNGFLLTSYQLFKTTDEAQTWHTVDLPSEIGFTDISFNKNIGFITGKLGVILRTEDYGNTWNYCNTKLYPHLNSLAILSSDSIFACGDVGTFLFSQDGGKKWEQQFSNTSEEIKTLFWINKSIYAAGNFSFLHYHAPEILQSFQWNPSELLLKTDNNRAVFSSPEGWDFSVQATTQSGKKITDTFFIEVYQPGIFISHDSVARNNQIQLHAITNAGSWSLTHVSSYQTWYHDVEFINESTGFIVGQFDSKGVLLKTIDGGVTWNHVPQKINRRLNDIEFVNKNTGFASGYLGYMIKTTDGGNTWHELTVPTNDDINTFSFADENIGFAAADHGEILKTVDGGESWKITKLNYDFATKILFLDANKGFLLHNYSGFWSTVDGGKSWNEVEHDRFFDMMDIQFVNEQTGYVVGGMLQPFHFLKTTDGGLTWNQKVYPRWTLTSYRTLCFEDVNSGFVFNDLGEIITTADGGQNWFILDTLRYPGSLPGGIGFNINAFQYLNENRGIGVGNGLIFSFEKPAGLKYSWLPENEVQGKNTAHPYVTAEKTGMYYGLVKGNWDCEAFGAVDVPLLTSNKLITNLNEPKIYPTPSNDYITIEYSNMSDFDFWEIIDNTGKTVLSEKVTSANRFLIKHNLTPGLYFLHLAGKNNHYRKKIIIQ